MSGHPLRIAVAGANGRLGRMALRAIEESSDFTVAAALGRGSALDATSFQHADVLVDFTTPESSVALARLTSEARLAHVIGTTGFSPAQEQAIAEAAAKTAILKSGNMSVGVWLLAALVKRAAAQLKGFDIEVLEMHHRMKADAPSGTALLLGQAAAEGREISFAPKLERSGPRSEDEIGFASLRGGTVVGEHAVIFAGPQERLTLTHTAEDRMIFASGALAAARWLMGRAPGLYSMGDVLGLNG